LRVPHYDQAISLRLVKSALSFWGIALLSNGVLLIDYIVMSQFLPPSEIVLYSVMIGILNVLLLFYTSSLMVFWPEWSRYFLQGKIAQMRAWVLRSSILGVLGCVVLTLVMSIALPDVLRLWLGRPTFTVSLTTILCFSSYLAIRIWTDTHAIALMSANQTRWLMLTVFLQLLVNLPAEIILGRAFGANGIVGGLIVGFVLTATWMLPYRFYQRRDDTIIYGC
jgi:O-antigen/teichoic acid export membrane protein